jgi:hypothetical protein
MPGSHVRRRRCFAPVGVVNYSSPVHVPGSMVEYGCGVAGPNLPGTMRHGGVEYVAGSLQPRDGDSLRVCQADDGTWNGSAPTVCPPCCSATTCCDCYPGPQGCYRPDWPGVGSVVGVMNIRGVAYPYGFDAWAGECQTDDDYCGCQCGLWAPRSCGMGPNGECGADDDCDRAC